MEKFIKNTAIKSDIIPNLLGNSHRYKTLKGEISLVHPCASTMDSYEIYCIQGELFDDIEIFDSLEEAEGRIYELLE